MVTFNAASGGTPSVLQGVVVSPGLIVAGDYSTPVAFNADAGDTEQYIAVGSDVLAAAGNQIAIVAQKPEGFPFSTVKFKRWDNEFDGILTGVSDANPFTITVNNGIGYTDTEYKFIVKVLEAPSVSDDNVNIVLTGDGAVFKRRAADGSSGDADFITSITSYNLEFTNAAKAVAKAEGVTLTATPPDDGAVTIDWNGPGSVNEAGSVLTIDSVSARNAPVRFTFTKNEKLPAVYTVFFVNTEKVDAKLSEGLSFTGGCTITPAFDPAVYKSEDDPYIVDVPSNVNMLLPENVAGDPAGLNVEYTPLHNPANTTPFIIRVGDGDADYATKTYYFEVNKLNALSPVLTGISIIAGGEEYLPSFEPGILSHYIVVPSSNSATTAQIAWTYVSADIASVCYAVDNDDWSGHTAGGFNLTGLTAGTSKLVRIRVRTTDGQEAEYRITFSHEASSANKLTSLLVKKNGSSGSDLSGDIQPSLALSSDY
jgi:hypothetical protein